MGGDRLHIAQRTMGFDQHMDGQGFLDPMMLEAGIDEIAGLLHIRQMARLGHHQISQAVTSGRDQALDIGFEARMTQRMNSCADPAMPVVRAVQERGQQQHMISFAADRRTVFAVERDVEQGPHLRLHRQTLDHARLDAAVMVDNRQQGRNFAGFE